MEKSTILILLLITFFLLFKSNYYIKEEHFEPEFKNMIQLTKKELNKKIQNGKKKVNFSSDKFTKLFDYNDIPNTIKSNPIINEPMEQQKWIDQVRDLYPLQENHINDYAIPENSNDKFKFKNDDGEDKTIAELFNIMSGELDNDITDEQLKLIGGKDVNYNQNINFDETILFESVDAPFGNRETKSKYSAFNGNSFVSLL